MADAAQRRAYLRAMGIQPWVRRAGVDGEAVQVAAEASVAVETPSPVAEKTAPIQSPPPSVAVPAEMPASSAPDTALSPEPARSPENPCGDLDWDALQATVSQCTACELHTMRRQAVFGCGDRSADWMIIGEAPGQEEDRQGEPFIGRAGQLLNNMLRAVELSREQVYIANVIKCHPPGDRNPHMDEISQCFGYLQRQIALVKPKLILVVGRVAAHALLKVNGPLGSLRGQVHQFADVPLVVTYHPAYLLRKPSEKAKSWQDLRLARRVAAGQTQ